MEKLVNVMCGVRVMTLLCVRKHNLGWLQRFKLLKVVFAYGSILQSAMNLSINIHHLSLGINA